MVCAGLVTDAEQYTLIIYFHQPAELLVNTYKQR